MLRSSSFSHQNGAGGNEPEPRESNRSATAGCLSTNSNNSEVIFTNENSINDHTSNEGTANNSTSHENPTPECSESISCHTLLLVGTSEPVMPIIPMMEYPGSSRGPGSTYPMPPPPPPTFVPPSYGDGVMVPPGFVPCYYLPYHVQTDQRHSPPPSYYQLVPHEERHRGAGFLKDADGNIIGTAPQMNNGGTTNGSRPPLDGGQPPLYPQLYGPSGAQFIGPQPTYFYGGPPGSFQPHQQHPHPQGVNLLDYKHQYYRNQNGSGYLVRSVRGPNETGGANVLYYVSNAELRHRRRFAYFFFIVFLLFLAVFIFVFFRLHASVQHYIYQRLND